jgi:hypothetical protein
MQRNGATNFHAAAFFLRVIAQTLQANIPGSKNSEKAVLQIGAIAFIHRFGSSLNEHMNFHVCAVDGVFANAAGQGFAWHSPKRVIPTKHEILGQLARCNHPNRAHCASL